MEIKPTLIACDNVAKMGLLHSVQRAKKFTAFRDPHLQSVVCQLVWDPAEMKIGISSELCKRLNTIVGDTSRTSASEYAEANGSLSKHAIILVSR
jgi:hypothetical protein